MADEGRIGVLGGSGLYEMDGLRVLDEVTVSTPFGDPSDSYLLGELDGHPVAFLPRHGKGHRFTPAEVNYRANIYGLKKLGVTRIVAVSAVGSLREQIHPRHVVLPDQFIDRTQGRAGTFFGDGVVVHISFADPVCPQMHAVLRDAAEQAGATVWAEGTYVCMEGPAFSTRAESRLYRSWGASVIGMTNLPEAKLAREAEMCYATLALVTDFDCWHQCEEQVSVEMLVENLRQNAATAQAIVKAAVNGLPGLPTCGCNSALAKALLTAPQAMPPATKKRLELLIAKYVE